MPLMIKHEDERDCPVMVCDHCGQKIEDAKEGNYQWIMSPAPAAAFFTHKKCCYAFEQARPGSWGAVELECLPVYLANNLGVKWTKARKTAALFSRL